MHDLTVWLPQILSKAARGEGALGDHSPNCHQQTSNGVSNAGKQNKSYPHKVYQEILSTKTKNSKKHFFPHITFFLKFLNGSHEAECFSSDAKSMGKAVPNKKHQDILQHHLGTPGRLGRCNANVSKSMTNKAEISGVEKLKVTLVAVQVFFQCRETRSEVLDLQSS